MNLSDDDFTLLGLPQQQALDRTELDLRRRDLQAQVHPDRHAAQGAATQRLAVQWAVRVNEAYNRLKDPLTRAAYLCELRGVAIDAERNTAMPPAFLLQQMDWREQLDEATGAAAVEALDLAVVADQRRRLAELVVLLDEAQDTAAAAVQVRALMFVVRFRQVLARRLDVLDPAR